MFVAGLTLVLTLAAWGLLAPAHEPTAHRRAAVVAQACNTGFGTHFEADYDTCTDCDDAGIVGLNEGWWTSYRCAPAHWGWRLLVSPSP